MMDPEKIFRTIQAAAASQAATANQAATVVRFQLGLTWSSCRIRVGEQESIGFAMSPSDKSRTLAWPGSIAGRSVAELSNWLLSWNSFEATLALAACNAAINHANNALMASATVIDTASNADAPPNLAVFRYFLPKLSRQRIVVIGRYPGMDKLLAGLDVTVLERSPGPDDLPDTAAEFVLRQADWVFLTATSLLNKSFSRLAELARDAVTVLMGPSTPWLEEFMQWNIDFVAGVVPVDAAKAEQIVAEGGGTQLFHGGVSYAVANLSAARLAHHKKQITSTVALRQQLTTAMSTWYHQHPNNQRFPDWTRLEATDRELSRQDTAYKRLWDANQAG
jgi:uncharacterized protein